MVQTCANILYKDLDVILLIADPSQRRKQSVPHKNTPIKLKSTNVQTCVNTNKGRDVFSLIAGPLHTRKQNVHTKIESNNSTKTLVQTHWNQE